MYYIQSRKAFTLIELSIVLIIIGLIVGAIMTGQSLMRRSKVNSIMLDAQTYITAAGNFKQKYEVLPGDMYNATSYWGSLANNGLTCPPTPGSVSPGGTATCNGNGNGEIENGYEDSYFWQHLANAQMIAGHYTGYSPTPVSAGASALFSNIGGVNVPAGRIDGSAFGLYYTDHVIISSFFINKYQHIMLSRAGHARDSA